MSLLKRGSWFLSKAICAGICALLGASCADGPFDNKAEYGVPSARYKLDGTVLDRRIATPVEGIRIRMATRSNDTTGAVRSDRNGRWAIDARLFPCSDACSLRAEDVDGLDHGGHYASRTIPIAPARTEPPNGWDTGTFEQHDITIEIWNAPGTSKDEE